MSTTTLVNVTIEGQEYVLEDREYSGRELRTMADLAARDKLVREEEDGSETAIPPGKKLRFRTDDNLFVSVRFRRG